MSTTIITVMHLSMAGCGQNKACMYVKESCNSDGLRMKCSKSRKRKLISRAMCYLILQYLYDYTCFVQHSSTVCSFQEPSGQAAFMVSYNYEPRLSGTVRLMGSQILCATTHHACGKAVG